MVSLYVPEPSFFGELSNVVRLFRSERAVAQGSESAPPADARLAIQVFFETADGADSCTVQLYENGQFKAAVTEDTRFLRLR